MYILLSVLWFMEVSEMVYSGLWWPVFCSFYPVICGLNGLVLPVALFRLQNEENVVQSSKPLILWRFQEENKEQISSSIIDLGNIKQGSKLIQVYRNTYQHSPTDGFWKPLTYEQATINNLLGVPVYNSIQTLGKTIRKSTQHPQKNLIRPIILLMFWRGPLPNHWNQQKNW